eukprot:TRINITY_DN11092_c0_g1_i1.p1 TRINITY_DN11092_c0_g1~~TRINITY_DN11092_c0_g1_i1.p1  ORF type:complete len:1213 (+),score=315.82 TRINITY_DN11092_c0_g1_i1:56-3694(+)
MAGCWVQADAGLLQVGVDARLATDLRFRSGLTLAAGTVCTVTRVPGVHDGEIAQLRAPVIDGQRSFLFPVTAGQVDVWMEQAAEQLSSTSSSVGEPSAVGCGTPPAAERTVHEACGSQPENSVPAGPGYVKTVRPPAGFQSCAWRRSAAMADKVPREEMEFAAEGEDIVCVEYDRDWVQSVEHGLFLPAKYVTDPPSRHQVVTCRVESRKRYTGTVESWGQNSAGFLEGAIVVDSPPKARMRTVRVHVSQVTRESGARGYLVVGERVMFCIGEPRRRSVVHEAQDVTDVDGKPIRKQTADWTLEIPQLKCSELKHTDVHGRDVEWSTKSGWNVCRALGSEVVLSAGADTVPCRLMVSITGGVWSQLSGQYDLQRTQKRDMPWWRKTGGGGWLSSTPQGRWMFALEQEHFEAGKGWVLSELKHHGGMPTSSQLRWVEWTSGYVWQRGGWTTGWFTAAVDVKPMCASRVDLREASMQLALPPSNVVIPLSVRLQDVDIGAKRELQRVLGSLVGLCAKAGVAHSIPETLSTARARPLGRRTMDAAAAAGDDAVCMLFARGLCPMQESLECERGRHLALQHEMPQESELFASVSAAQMGLLQRKWTEAGGHGNVVRVWEVRNQRSAEMFRLTEHSLAKLNGRPSVQIEAFHGTRPENVVSIAQHGFDPARRAGQLYGAGEYFAKDPTVSVGYCGGGRFMFLCRLHLGEEGQERDHVWVNSCKYYVVKQRDCMVQALPMYVLEFECSYGCGDENAALRKRLDQLAAENVSVAGAGLLDRFRGATKPCAGRRDAGMHVASTTQLWLGWLMPDQTQEELISDMKEHLAPHTVTDVVAERSAMRLGAWVTLKSPISRAEFEALRRKRYRGRYEISVDDESVDCPVRSKQLCPRLAGPSKYCRGWNLRGTAHWHTRCRFAHPEAVKPTCGIESGMEFHVLEKGSAKYDQIVGEFAKGIRARVVRVTEVVNPALEKQYLERKAYLEKTFDGTITEAELWHGTHKDAVQHMLTHGLQPPSDTNASSDCPHSGGKGATTLCDNRCAYCTEPHRWDMCHMYGLGIYLADLAQKSHRYVRGEEEMRWVRGAFRTEAECTAEFGSSAAALWRGATRRCGVQSMLRCQTNLGSPYLIEGNLKLGDGMHDVSVCSDPSEYFDRTTQEWDGRRGNSAFFVKGQGYTTSSGKAVVNNEYIVYHPWQVWPRYVVHYTHDRVSGADDGASCCR